MTDAPTAIGVDVGGTRIRVARVDGAGRILERRDEAVRPDRAGFTDQLLRLVSGFRGGGVAVGIGLPGRVDAGHSRILSAGYLDIAGLDLAAAVSSVVGLPCRLENDATMALFAEARCAGLGDGVLAMMTIGTGIGGAVMADGRPWYGGRFSGQFGHLRVAADGPLCNCGQRGCVETLSSGTALGELVASAGLPPGHRGEALLGAARDGDDLALDLLLRWSAPCRRALHSIAAALDPDTLILGGGLGWLMAAALELADEPPQVWFRNPVRPARLGDDAGVIGAALRALDPR